MVIAIDFDGTCVTHDFPRVGKDIGAVPVLRELVAAGHQLILFTMRSDIENPTGDDPDLYLEPGNYLTDALEWFERNSIPLYGVQTNPTQSSWTTSPKAYAQLYIDDAALGCPLSVLPGTSARPFVDWRAVRLMLEHKGLLSTGEYCSCGFKMIMRYGLTDDAYCAECHKRIKGGVSTIL